MAITIAAAVYDQRPYRRLEIRWGNFLFALLFAVVASMALFTGRITTSRHSVSFVGAPARAVGVLFLVPAGLAFAGSFRRRVPDEH
jgi:hypothetical protein